MGQLLSLAVVIVVVYFMYTQALPWIEERFDEPTSGASAESGPSLGGSGCVDAAEGASQTLSGELVRFSRPPIDPDTWAMSYQTIARAISTAEVDCSGCFSASCRSAQSALSEMRGLAQQFDNAARGEAHGWSNPASAQERINSLLDQARSLP